MEQMRLNAPKQITWIIALILGVVGILATLVTLPVITPAIGFWLVVAGWALLLIATITHGL
jgi:protein-S-isoprenylcysteine O-methyltransferase Ste14